MFQNIVMSNILIGVTGCGGSFGLVPGLDMDVGDMWRAPIQRVCVLWFINILSFFLNNNKLCGGLGYNIDIIMVNFMADNSYYTKLYVLLSCRNDIYFFNTLPFATEFFGLVVRNYFSSQF